MTGRSVPYFSQFETPDIINAYEREPSEAVLAADPLWAASGAADRAEYARWAANVCGMACLKMILAAFGMDPRPTLALARECTAHGGYVVDAQSGAIKGLIYAPFVTYLAERFGLAATVVTGIAASDIPAHLPPGGFLIASVHPTIRRPDTEPPAKGGHLVLVTAASGQAITFHNPSGHTDRSRVDATLPPTDFARFFAGRGIVVAPLAR